MFHLRHLALPLYLAWGEYVMSTHELLEKEMQTLSHQNSCSTILKSRHGVIQEIYFLQFFSQCMKPQHISFIWYAGEGGPGHEEGRPSALLNIGHQSQTWLWYFFKLRYFETFDTFKLLVKGQSGQTMKNSPLPTLKGLPVKTERKHWLRKDLYFILNYFCLGNRVGRKQLKTWQYYWLTSSLTHYHSLDSGGLIIFIC